MSKKRTVSQELFDCSNADENFLKNVITGDETWLYGYNIEIKLNCRSGWENRRRNQKKSMSQSIKHEGVVDHFFLWEGHCSS
jgi:hypothetical protein